MAFLLDLEVATRVVDFAARFAGLLTTFLGAFFADFFATFFAALLAAFFTGTSFLTGFPSDWPDFFFATGFVSSCEAVEVAAIVAESISIDSCPRGKTGGGKSNVLSTGAPPAPGATGAAEKAKSPGSSAPSTFLAIS